MFVNAFIPYMLLDNETSILRFDSTLGEFTFLGELLQIFLIFEVWFVLEGAHLLASMFVN